MYKIYDGCFYENETRVSASIGLTLHFLCNLPRIVPASKQILQNNKTVEISFFLDIQDNTDMCADNYLVLNSTVFIKA
jgi:hypothetical protein